MLYPIEEFGEHSLYPKSGDFAIEHISSTIGRGVVSYKNFLEGETIARLAGYIIPEIRQHTLQISAYQHLLDPYFSGYFLHSCDPNISVDMNKLIVVARKDIKKQDILYMDYAETEDILFVQFDCSCRSNICRGRICGRLESPLAS